jgi:hypothetical protein
VTAALALSLVEGLALSLVEGNHWAGTMAGYRYWACPELVEGIAAPSWIEHQRAPGSRNEPKKSADGSVVKGVGLGLIQQSGRHVDP